MSGATEADVRRELRKLLVTADFDVETERSLRKKVEEKLRCPVNEHKQIIKDEINSFLLEQTAADEAGRSDSSDESVEDDAEMEAAFMSEMAGGSGKRKQAGSTGKAAKRVKKPAVFHTGVLGRGTWNDEGEWVSKLNDVKRVTVRNFKGTIYVDIREFYQKDGDWLPGKKGLALKCEEWAATKPAMDEILGKIQQGITAHVHDISELRKMKLREFKGYRLVDFREFYDKDGELAPSKKGISLSADLFATLTKRRKDVDQAVLALGGDPGPEVASSAGAEDSPVAGGRQGAPVPAVRAGTGGDTAEVQLSGERLRASISEFQGKPTLNIRHYYQKNDEWLPAKKGISLTLDQAQILMDNVADITTSVEAADKSLDIMLSDNRKVTISIFNAKTRVDIREWYTPAKKGAQPQPGAKGVSLTEEQWGILAQSLDALMESASRQ